MNSINPKYTRAEDQPEQCNHCTEHICNDCLRRDWLEAAMGIDWYDVDFGEGVIPDILRNTKNRWFWVAIVKNDLIVIEPDLWNGKEFESLHWEVLAVASMRFPDAPKIRKGKLAC